MKNWIIWIILAVLMGVVALTYSNHFHNALHFDDAHAIENNIYIRDIHNIPLFFKDGTTSSNLPPNRSYRPVLTTTLAIDYYMGKGLADTFYFHVTSFTFFILLGILMFVLFRRILRLVSSEPNTDWVALFAVAWFMLHPACAETINYIIQRGDSLSTFFVVLGLTLYAVSPFCRKYFIYLLPVAIGILTKPSALMFGPILFCYIILFDTEKGFLSIFPGVISLFKTNRGTLIKGVIAIVTAFAICAIGFWFVSKMQPSSYVSGSYTPDLYRLTQPFIIFYYFTAWFAPIHLTADTDWTVLASAADPYAILGFVFLFFAIVAMFITSEYKITRPIAFGLAWFILANAPTSLAAFSEVENDHRMFFPFVGLSLAVVWTFYLLMMLVVKSSKINVVVKASFFTFLAVMLMGYAYGTHQRNKVWKDDISLWGDCAIKSPDNGRGLMNYGLAYMRYDSLAKAEKYYSQGLDRWPYYAYLHVNMAILKDRLGKKAEADQYFRNGVAYGAKTYPESYFFYARFLNANGRRAEGIKQLYNAYNTDVANPTYSYLLMDMLYPEKRYEELKTVANNTLAAAPGDVKAANYLKLAVEGKSQLQIAIETAEANKTADNYLNLSLQYYNAGDYQGCINAARKSLELKPDYAAAYNNIGTACNMLKKYGEAKEALLKALQYDPKSELAKNNLKVAEQGLIDQKSNH